MGGGSVNQFDKVSPPYRDDSGRPESCMPGNKDRRIVSALCEIMGSMLLEAQESIAAGSALASKLFRVRSIRRGSQTDGVNNNEKLGVSSLVIGRRNSVLPQIRFDPADGIDM